MQAIIIMGVSGSGKSTLAAALAGAWDSSFIEGDGLHDDAARAKMAAGEALTDQDRWPWLDRISAAINADLAEKSVPVIATCSALRRCYRDRLRAAVAAPLAFVCLDLPRAELEYRLAQRSGHYMPLSLLDSQLATFEPPVGEDDVLILADDIDPIAAIENWLRDGV
jgi:gluconokinase